MLVPKETIRDIKNRVDIVELTKEYINGLKKVGKNWVGLCPFHNDNNPSLNVSPDIGIFKCFSCGEGGDIFSFIQKIENISFAEAVALLAKKAGVPLNLKSEQAEEEYQKKEELLQFNNRLIKLFQYFLLEKDDGKEALRYLSNRGIDFKLIDIFKIGYAPNGYNTLLNIFKKKAFKEDFLIKTGLIVRNDRGLRPLFFDRIVFPIINQNEECIGFGARVLKSEVKPKYINSPETALYKKSYNLYGLNLAKRHIREKKYVFIVEGYMDLISCFKNGLKNVVAPCGTAITNGQISLLKRYAEEIIFLMDADEAGKKSVERTLRESSDINIKKSVIILPKGMDPDDYFKKNNEIDFKVLYENRIDAFDFFVKNKFSNIDKNDYKVLTDKLNEVFQYIQRKENEIVQNSLVERLADLIEINKGSIAKDFLSFKNKLRYSYKDTEKEFEKDNSIKLDEFLKREIDLILLFLQVGDALDLVKKCSLREEHFSNKLTQKLFKIKLNDNFSTKNKDFLEYIDDNEVKNYIELRLFSDEFKQSELNIRNNIIDRSIDLLKKYHLRINEEINQKLRLGELYNDNDLVKHLQEEKTIVINEILKLSKLQELKHNA